MQTTLRKNNTPNYKTIDSLWIMPFILKQIESNQLNMTNKLFNQILIQFSQVIASRIKNLDDKIRINVFAVASKWYIDFDTKYFNNTIKLSYFNKKLRKILITSNYYMWKKEIW